MFFGKDEHTEREENAQENTAQQEGASTQELASNYCEADLRLLKDKFVRLGADFQNYKVRVEKDRVLWMDKARTDVLLGLLRVVDDFDRALEESRKKSTPELQQWLAGFELIHKALYQYLRTFDVVPMEDVKRFDASLHEAVTQIPSKDHQSGEIVDVMERGFMHKGNVLRVAKVIVAQ